jgi:hypothetical protein
MGNLGIGARALGIQGIGNDTLDWWYMDDDFIGTFDEHDVSHAGGLAGSDATVNVEVKGGRRGHSKQQYNFQTMLQSFA